MNKTSRVYRWTFFPPDDYDIWDHIDPKIFKSIVFQAEICPDTGRFHFQGFFRLFNAKKLRGAQKMLHPTVKMNMEVPDGSDWDNYVYCTKIETRVEDTLPYECGVFSDEQGRRTDLEDIGEQILEGIPMYEIAAARPKHYIRYHSGMESLASLVESNFPVIRDATFILILGETGSGKTQFCLDNYPDSFWPTKATSEMWWDGYHGQATIVLDNFASGFMGFIDLCRLLDTPPLRLKIHHGFVYWKATTTTLIITSTKPIEDWYHFDGYNFREIKRRFHRVLHLRAARTTPLRMPEEAYFVRRESSYYQEHAL